MNASDYPTEAIEAQFAYWAAGTMPTGPEAAHALMWRDTIAKGLPEHLKSDAIARFTDHAYKLWRAHVTRKIAERTNRA